MILLIHDNQKVVQILDLDKNIEIKNLFQNPIRALFKIAKKYPEKILIWCHESQKNNLNFDGIKASFHIKNIMCSYSLEQYLPLQIGYVEDSPFIKINKEVRYPTWLMSSNVGAICASQLLKFMDKISIKESFDYALNSIAKLGMPNGLLCYSEPNLLKDTTSNIKSEKAKTTTLFKFVKQHYKTRWVLLLLLNFVCYENKFSLFTFLKSLFYKKRNCQTIIKTEIVKSTIQTNSNKTIDVIIPTIGRKHFLYGVLMDLSNQTLLPKQVIIVEQNPEPNSKSELHYLSSQKWPFKIVHKFTNQTGVCNARNLALREVTADFVYLADDDNRFVANLLKSILYNMQNFKFDVITMSYLQKNEKEIHKQPFQWSTFGAGCSVIATKHIDFVSFDKALEFGYGEDVDFGMQLRNIGLDVIYFPNLIIEHLKAPIGGFRVKFHHPWEKKEVTPKPSPTVMYNRLKNNSKSQLLGYKTVLFFKYYKTQSIKNPISYLKRFREQWEQSLLWANKLKNSIN